MDKKTFTYSVAILINITLVTTSFLFSIPYLPTNPPYLDDTGSTQDGIQAVINANNQLAFDLYLKFDESEEGNIFFSPFSIFSALAMTFEGAAGQTADEIESVLHLSDNNMLIPNYAAIYNQINHDNGQCKLRTGNALWTQQDYPFLTDYTQRLVKYYGGKAADLDFVNNAEISRETINRFIDDQTDGKIQEILVPGSINQLTRFVLTNAIYFNGNWLHRFDKADTQVQNFKISAKKTVQTPMMRMDRDKIKPMNFAGTEDFQILELPYIGEKFSMLILLPRTNLESIKPGSLSQEKFKVIRSKFHEITFSSISIPKFEFETNCDLGKTLGALGMPTAFTSGADFSKMNANSNLKIDMVVHQAYVKVDEKGTEAAAATAVGGGLTSAPPEFKANRPFLFIIQERSTGNILFMGRVTDPTQ